MLLVALKCSILDIQTGLHYPEMMSEITIIRRVTVQHCLSATAVTLCTQTLMVVRMLHISLSKFKAKQCAVSVADKQQKYEAR